jgi:hypothetical protein
MVQAHAGYIRLAELVGALSIATDVISARLPNARKVVMAGAGHWANMVQPEAFSRIVLDFLRSASQSKTDTPANPAPL